MDSIREIINSKNIRETSKKTHLQRLSFLYNNLQDNIYNTRLVKKFIEDRYDNPNSKRNYYDSMYVLTEKKIYKTIMDKLIKIVNENRLDNTISENDYISLEELKYIPTILENKIKTDYGVLWLTSETLLYSLNKRVRQCYIRDIIEYIILILHIYHPLRLDYYNMKLVFKKKDITKNENYILLKANKAELYMNVYKNSDNYDKTNIQTMEPIIANTLSNWIKIYRLVTLEEPKYVIYKLKVNLKLDVYTNRASLGAYLTHIIANYAHKHVTINIIRKIHESAFIQSEEYNKLSNKEKTSIHSKLLHSMSTAITDYNKVI